MRGQVLGVDARTGDGVVAGDDGRRYRFGPTDWAQRGEPAVGVQVDFETHDDRALSIFPMPVAGTAAVPVATTAATRVTAANDRNKYVAALLAFFLGPLAIHRFYLGRNRSAVLMLIMSITVVGMVITWPWALVDTVRYLMMSDEEFANRYPRGR